MSGSFTAFSRNRAVGAGVGLSQAATSAMYLALGTALPTGPGTATLASFAANEITTGGYSRQAVTWDTAAGGTIANAGTIDFGAFSADPPSASHIFECDTSTGTTGNVIAYWELDEAIDAGDGDFIRISPGDLGIAVNTCP